MDVLDWLLDSDPAVRWQVLRDLAVASPEEVAAERKRVATHSWGARLLALQEAGGQWDGGTYWPSHDDDPEGQPWTATTYTLLLLREFGLDPASQEARHAISLVKANSRWEEGGQPFFEGEVEPCINGMTVALGAYFGEDVDAVVDRLAGGQLADGGWNCDVERGSTRSSFHTTICVLEGLLEHERATGGTSSSREARRRGEEYLLKRSLLRRESTGAVISDDWLKFSFPTRWYYDVLRGLDYFRAAGELPGETAGAPDKRLAEAVGIVRSKQQRDGTWLLENTHPGKVHFALEAGDGEPSRWNTLRALRVLRWYGPS
ncbi:hypothetical protein Asphe3_37980 [Pseudarthrobacter phenanthrenivorans Sphe3]|uniref:Squalene cyclase n=1 Tax=Pseudarthrobacter phenanthrenivorans (strain DSM 18606 / JCM 16027 / LMG 23796 / Sphe3) TaxID=930171 RepID=F0M8G9_PSEPM|nr:hypothetical protein [Pseudarthrobacter phenanthrenivorans]ADX74887.1 hypothetical protein Asphe3_37980 [Pseudarthrobacter phenanthrenivorans Sphe3]